eukprot:12639.XXX_700433_697667_1 [CDS] Oithona nana genome sequencing.
MGPRRLSNVSYTPIGLNVGQLEKLEMEREAAKHGLGVITAAIFLAGEMAGSGVLALPFAMVGTGWAGVTLILLFTLNAAFSGTRLGLCWVILEERYAEFRKEIRDPYPSIGEKAVGKWGRMLCTVCICLTLYGAGCVFIVLISQLVQSLMEEIGVLNIDNLCLWMLIVTVFLTPLTWLGTPKDFWPIAVGALLTTVAACILIIIQALLDHHETTFDGKVNYGSPTLEGSIKAFASIMFAFAGASTFPTIQADMKHKDQFKISAIIACTILFLIYLPMAIAPYYGYGMDAQANIVMSLSKGWMRTTVEVMLLLHLVAAFPIILNPPAQYFEHIMNIPSVFNWKRCALRTVSVFVLLFIAETIPSFGSILDLVGASTVTMLTFVCPPYFYMRLCDSSKQNKEWTQRELPTWERIYCWVLIVVGFLGGAAATYISVKNIVSTSFQMPCYLQSGNVTIDSSH